MTSSDQPTGASAEGHERPEGVIFLGESQWVLGNRPPPGGPLTTVLAVPPLRSTVLAMGWCRSPSTCGCWRPCPEELPAPLLSVLRSHSPSHGYRSHPHPLGAAHR